MSTVCLKLQSITGEMIKTMPYLLLKDYLSIPFKIFSCFLFASSFYFAMFFRLLSTMLIGLSGNLSHRKSLCEAQSCDVPTGGAMMRSINRGQKSRKLGEGKENTSV